MTVETTATRNGPYTGDGSNSAFAYTFPIFSAGELEVIKLASGTETTLSSAIYSVSGVGSAGGGSVVLNSANIPTSAETITIRRSPPFTQEIDLQNQGGYHPEVQEKGLDYSTMQALYLREMLTRSLRMPVSDASSVSMILPVASARASGYLSFNSAGEPTVVTGVLPDDVVVTAFMETFLAASAASGARGVLSVPLLTNGTLVVGASAEIGSVGGLGADPVAQFFGSSTNIALELLAYSATATFAGLKANGTIGSASNVASGDVLAAFMAFGFFSAGYLKGAEVRAVVDGTPASNAMPTKLVMQTTRPGASAPVDTLALDAKGNVIVGSAQLATNATDGFVYVPNMAGVPTSTPTTVTGRTPLVYDDTNNHLYGYDGSEWRKIGAFTKTAVRSGLAVIASGSAGTATWSHGLGELPFDVTAWASCTSADQGYSAGDLIKINPSLNGSDNTNGGMTMKVDASNVAVRWINSGSLVAINGSNNSSVQLDGTKWTITLKAWV